MAPAGPSSISFPDYGPIAFEGFWRLPRHGFESFVQARLASRLSTNEQGSFFFTQYGCLDVPLGSDHTLTILVPWYHFRVDPRVAQEMNMANASGAEFGDIGVVFHVRFLKRFLARQT